MTHWPEKKTMAEKLVTDATAILAVRTIQLIGIPLILAAVSGLYVSMSETNSRLTILETQASDRTQFAKNEQRQLSQTDERLETELTDIRVHGSPITDRRLATVEQKLGLPYGGTRN